MDDDGASNEQGPTGDRDRIAGLQGQVTDLEQQLIQMRQQLSRAELDQWRGRIDDLEVQAHLASLDVRDQLRPLIKDLRNVWLDARDQLSGTGDTAADVVDTLRGGLERAMGEIRSAVLDARTTAKG